MKSLRTVICLIKNHNSDHIHSANTKSTCERKLYFVYFFDKRKGPQGLFKPFEGFDPNWKFRDSVRSNSTICPVDRQFKSIALEKGNSQILKYVAFLFLRGWLLTDYKL